MIWVAMNGAVARLAEAQTTIRVVPLVHDSPLMGFTPGAPNEPWADLFARICSYFEIP